MKYLSRLIHKVLDVWFVDVSSINRRIFSLPIKNIPYREELFNKHLQNLIWISWFGKLLHKEDE